MTGITPEGFEIDRDFAAPPSAVFAAWTTAEHFARWFGGKDVQIPADRLDYEPTVGRAWSATMVLPDGNTMDWTGEFLEVVPDKRLVGDVAGAAAYLKAMPSSNGKVATIGYCSGGRQSFLAACSLQLDAAVDCYGAFVVAPPPEGAPVTVAPIVHLAKDLSCPLLGLFGADDQFPSPDEVRELEQVLTEYNKTFEFHSYEGAGHAFFATNRASYRPEAANDGWERIWGFFDMYLGK